MYKVEIKGHENYMLRDPWGAKWCAWAVEQTNPPPGNPEKSSKTHTPQPFISIIRPNSWSVFTCYVGFNSTLAFAPSVL